MSTHSGSATNRNIIFYGFEPDKEHDISRSLHEQGVNLLRAAPSDIRTIVARDQVQLGYDIYVRNLPKFIQANELQQIVDFNPPFVSLLAFCKTPLSLSFPPLTVSFSKPLADSENILADVAFSKGSFRNEYQYTFPKPTLELVKKILPLKPNRTCQVPNGSVNIDALNRFAQVCCLVQAVLSIQNYPAFSVDDLVEHANTPITRKEANSSNIDQMEDDSSNKLPSAKRFAEVR
jgi:hypothetical protein